MKKLAIAALVLTVASPLFAWGEKGHLLANEAATYAVPFEMPRFFHEAYPSLVYLGYDPDRLRGAGDSLEEVNAPDHFLDYEYVAPLQLPNKRYDFMALMESSGTLKRNLIRNDTTGFVPWRVAEICDLLAREWQLWKASKSPIERRAIEQTIVAYAGILGHFVADSANPHHSTINYNGWASSENPKHFRTDCSTHFRFESDFVNHELSIGDIVPLMTPAVRRDNYFESDLELLHQSNSLVDTIYTLDRDGAFDGTDKKMTAEGRAFAASRLAAGASLLRDLWWSTYRNGIEGKARMSRRQDPD